MSSRASIFLTDDNVHWYEDVFYLDEREDGKGYRITMEIPKEDIKKISFDKEDGLEIEINGASLLAKEIRKIRRANR